jgi:hypothetical protein
LILVLLVVSALSNIGLPTESSSIETLSQLDKARAAEAVHLRSEMGDRIWPEWDEAEIPLILHNEAYAFLIGFPGDPPAGWMKVPANQQEGGEWQLIPNDTFRGEGYYRQPLVENQANPENFTVKLGEHWAATLFTKEYAEISFYEGFQEELPGLLRKIFPYRLFWKLAFGSSETYIQGLAHESFHAFQGSVAPTRLSSAEKIAYLENDYPWEDQELQDAWKDELDFLYQAVTAESDEQAFELAGKFLEKREDRRQLETISLKEIDYERNREWLEGLAKYSELALGLAAFNTETYQPIPELESDPDFNSYQNQDRYLNQQLAEVKRQANQRGETRFYYSGMAQAFLLDRLSPDWKDQIWEEGVWLEDLLKIAVY